MLKLKIPSFCPSEQRYTLDAVLGDFLGLAFEVECYEGNVIEIDCSSAGLDDATSTAKLTLDASFFHKARRAWLKPESMPILPLPTWTPEEDGIQATLVEPFIPVLYGKPGLVKNGTHFHLNLDIFGSAFFLLSRYEELIVQDKEKDKHNRFPATASVAFKAKFLDRPIVNEYVEILWDCLKRLWPFLNRKEKKFRKLITCDVDHPFDLAGYSLKKTILRVGARFFRDRNPKLASLDFLNYVFKKVDSDKFDAYKNNIDWIMDVNARIGNKVTFNFIPVQTDPNWEELNDVRSAKISALLRRIERFGHDIGFHPGYQTYRSEEKFQHSACIFKSACESQKIDYSELGGRQHYLRYDIGITPQLWQKNGFKYDSSLGYSEMAGFRCGVCFEYQMYDLRERQKMALTQRPLIAMEGAVIGQLNQGFGFNYVNEGLGFGQESINRFENLKNVVQRFNGDYVLLWHNSYLGFAQAKSQYLMAI